MNHLGKRLLSNRTLLIGTLVLVMGVSSASGMGIAQEVNRAADEMGIGANGAEADLPISNVMLFGSGVGYFEHLGTVEDDQNVTLYFREEEINDLLKSLFLSDMDGGVARAVRYAGQDPISRVLSSYSINLGMVGSIPQLLSAARGERVRVVTTDETVSGTVFAVEQRPDAEGVSRDHLALVSNGTIRSVPLEEIHSVSFNDRGLQSELESALSAIASARQTDRKPVTLEFAGDGERQVAVGYVRETPVWKTSYRIVIDDDGASLQGWAIAENTTNQDWEDVRLSFVAGQPLSFVMNLYDPVYVERPVVQPMVSEAVAAPDYEASARRLAEALSGFGGRAREEAFEAEMMDDFASVAAPSPRDSAAQSRSQGQSVGGVFEYRITEPVTIPRHQSAMIPIVDTEIDLEAVSIYDASVLEAHPLRGALLTNNTGLHLMGGPVTVVEGGAYAGDARFSDIVEDETRQISYAVDIDVLVDREGASQPEQITRVRVVDGVVISSRLNRTRMEYTVTNRGDKARDVIVEHPRNRGWTLVDSLEPFDQSASSYRFRTTVAAGDTVVLPVSEERITEQRVSLFSLNDNQVGLFLDQRVISEELRQALSRLLNLREELSQLTARRRELETQVNGIYRSQERVTRNMEALDRDSDLYQRYVADLTEQEDRLGELETQIQDLRAQEDAKDDEIGDSVRDLNVN